MVENWELYDWSLIDWGLTGDPCNWDLVAQGWELDDWSLCKHAEGEVPAPGGDFLPRQIRIERMPRTRRRDDELALALMGAI